MLPWLLSFVLGFFVDALYVLYTKSVQNDQVWRAVFWSIAISISGIVGFMNAIEAKERFVPYVLGLGAGTYVAMKVGKKKD